MPRSSRFHRGVGLASTALLVAALLVAVASVPAPSSAAHVNPAAGQVPLALGELPELANVGARLARLHGPGTAESLSTRAPAAGSTDRSARPKCFGKRATIVGTRKADKLRGTKRRDVIVGGGGNDRIFGLGGRDLICGSGGSDMVSPGGGADRVDGGTGNDTLAASPGRDRLAGGPGSDWLDFRDSRRGVTASLAAGRSPGERWTSMENVVGSRHADRLTGDAAANQIRGGAGNDRLAGLGGDDALAGEGGDDVLDGGEGALDFVTHPSARRPITADLGAGTVTGEGTDRLVGVEGVVGSRRDDTLTGGGAVSILAGAKGDDTIVGNGSADFLLSLASAARVDLAAQHATSEGTDRISGIEVLIGTAGDDVLTGSGAADVILAGAGADTVTGGGDNDVLVGGDGPDILLGGDGDDVLRGDTGVDAADLLDGGAGSDLVDYGTSTAAVGVDLAAGTGPGGDTLVALEMVVGSAFGDTIRGDGFTNTLMGAAGDDVIAGAGGNDVVSGGPGVDSLTGGDGDDHLAGDDGGGAADGGAGSDLCTGLSPIVNCEASELSGGEQPGGTMLQQAAPEPDTTNLSTARARADASSRRTTRSARVPIFDWIGYGNPSVSCNDSYASTAAVITARMPSRVRPDYSSGNRQVVWLRQYLYDLSNPNVALQSSQWFYTVLNTNEWSTPYWYLAQGNGSDPLDAWYTTFGRNYQVNYSVIYDMWWQDTYTGQFLHRDWFTAWHGADNGYFSDRCGARAAGFLLDPYSGPTTTPTCSYNWSESFCAIYRLYFSSTRPYFYPRTSRAKD